MKSLSVTRGSSQRLNYSISHYCGFLGGSVVMPSNARNVSLNPRLGRSPEEGNGSPSSALAWKIPWREEPGRLQSMGLQGVGHDLVT